MITDQVREMIKHYFNTKDTNKLILEMEKYLAIGELTASFHQIFVRNGLYVEMVMVIDDMFIDLQLTKTSFKSTVTDVGSITSVQTTDGDGYFSVLIDRSSGLPFFYEASSQKSVHLLKKFGQTIIIRQLLPKNGRMDER